MVPNEQAVSFDRANQLGPVFFEHVLNLIQHWRGPQYRQDNLLCARERFAWSLPNVGTPETPACLDLKTSLKELSRLSG